MNSCAHMKPQATVPLPLTRRHNAAFESDLAGFMAEQKARGAERERRLHALLTNKAECHRLSDLLLLENRVRHSTEVFRNEYNYSFLVHNYCVSCSVPKNSRSASIAYSRKRSTASAYKFCFQRRTHTSVFTISCRIHNICKVSVATNILYFRQQFKARLLRADNFEFY